mmetsp:Transcript_53128/g.154609  ORF Transcript_53128/g.154609 Transcript_53128/m.154609 type:complete len:206 (+) Transcript_53128:742-1359(+)
MADTNTVAFSSSAMDLSLTEASFALEGTAPCLPIGFFSSVYPASLTRRQTSGPPFEKTSERSHAGEYTAVLGRVISAFPAGMLSPKTRISLRMLSFCSSFLTTRTLCLDASRTASLTTSACCTASESSRAFAAAWSCSSCAYQQSGHSRALTPRKAVSSSAARCLGASSPRRRARCCSSKAPGTTSVLRQALMASTSSSVSHPIV